MIRMYTRCPECQTAFKITVAQLKTRDGLVRCGRCRSVFRADLRLFAAPAADNAERAPYVDIPLTIEQADVLEIDLDDDEQADREIPVVSDLSLFQAPRRGVPTFVWAFGALLAALFLIGQFAYFYRNELAQLPALRPRLLQACEIVRCEVMTPVSVLLPELMQSSIAPHPRYANVLRLRASLVNRTEEAQPLPLFEVTLTGSDGQPLARRTFTPGEYVEPPANAAAALAPNVVVNALLDITNPDGKAVGYEVQLFPQQPARAD